MAIATGLAIAAGVAAAGSVAGGAIASSGAKNAAKTQAASADRASQQIDARFQQTRSDLSPFREAGIPALGRLNDMMTPGFQFNPQDPGYAFRFSEGTRAANTSAAARGNRLSGGQLKALTRYGTGVANQEFGGDFNRNLSLAQMGQNAAAQVGSFGQNAANAQADLTTGAGNAIAAGQIGSSNAIGGALSNIGQIGLTAATGGFGNLGGGGGLSGYVPPNLSGIGAPMPGIGWGGNAFLPSGRG